MRNAVQALLVILILLVLGALFPPAVIKIREAAARSQCTNNLKQLGLAVHNYHDTYNLFPRAALPNLDLTPEKRQSWVVEIWPFVEAGPLYNKIDHKKAWDAEENRFAALTTLRSLHCPAYPERPPVTPFFSMHYLGIAGVGVDAIQLPREDSRAGFLGYDRTFNLKDVADRTSSILMLAETSQASGAWSAAGPPTTRGLILNGPPYLGAGGQFGGNHPRGVNTVFADGSVRFVEQTIDPAAWEAMATLGGKGNQE
jgi:prepilin-type processing-associated H-X9-DG protein